MTLPAPSPLLSPPLPPGYTLERVVRRGGVGTLLAARRQEGGQRVALKLYHGSGPLEQELARTEAEALRLIGPPTVPGLLESGQMEGGPHYLVMQYLEHPLLAERLRQAGRLTQEEAGRHALALAEALERVHERGLLHRALKPGHVFLREGGRGAGLFDFALARAPALAGLALAGPAEYLAPEQCVGAPVLDGRVDVYATGVLLYEMLTGQPPFRGSAAEVREAHLSSPPPPPSRRGPVSPGLEEVVLRCLAKERAHRYGSARELAAALRQALGPSAGAPRASPSLPAPGSARRPVAVLFLRSGANPVALSAALGGCGGHLAWHGGTCFAAVFDPQVGEHPVRRARQCAEHLAAQGLAAGARVDVVVVWAQRRADGSPRYLGAALGRPEYYPAEEDPPWLLVTEQAAAALPEVAWVPVPGRPGLLRQASRAVVHEDTTVVWLECGELVGRQQELQALEESARAVVAERVPRLTPVLGERGHGKSHLAAALLLRLQEQLPQARVLLLRAREPVQGNPEATLRLLLRRVLGGAEPEQPGSEAAWRAQCEGLLGPGLAAELWPAVATCLGWREVVTELRAHGAAPGALRALTVRAVGELLAASAHGRPLLLLLDDAHYAEDMALEALEYATRAAPVAPLWVCVLGHPSLAQAHPSLARTPGVHLGPLPLASAMELCLGALRPVEGVPAEALQRLAERAQRVPLFLVELVRGLKRQGLVRQRAGGSWYLATDELERLPELPTVQWVAWRELIALPVELGVHARLCAVLGSDFSLAEVEGVVRELGRWGEDFALDPVHATRRLVELGLLVSRPQEGLRFRNELVREVVVRSLPEARLQRLHLAAYQYYAREARARERLPRLALHAAAAGLREEAAALYVDLAESARARHAYLQAESTYSRALELLPEEDGVRRLGMLRGRGLMRYRLGRLEDSLADFRQGRALGRRLGRRLEEAELLLEEAMALDWGNDYVRSAERVEEAQALAMDARLDTPLLQARLLLGLGRARYRQGEWEPARLLLEAAVEQARRLGDGGYESLVVALLLLGAMLPHLGRVEDAERVLEECVAECTARGDRLHLGAALNNRRNLWVARNELRRAVEDQERYMRLGRELGLVGWEYFAEHNLGELYYQEGDMGAAAPHIARALELERRHPEVATRPWALLLRARVLAYEGQQEPARQVLEALHRALAERPGVELSPSEGVLLSLVELATRPSSELEWQALLVRSRQHSVEQEPLEVLEVQALARLRQGEQQVAVRLLEQALQRAEHLPNIMRPRLQRSLLLARAGACPPG